MRATLEQIMLIVELIENSTEIVIGKGPSRPSSNSSLAPLARIPKHPYHLIPLARKFKDAAILYQEVEGPMLIPAIHLILRHWLR